MLTAINNVKKGMSGNKAADANGVPRSTLKDRLSGRVSHGIMPGPVKYLTADEEGMLVDYLLKCAEIGYGKTRRDVCCLVESYLQIKDKKHSDRQLSNGWWEKFIRRNSSLGLRVGDSTAGVRFDAVTAKNMNKYFELLKST